MKKLVFFLLFSITFPFTITNDYGIITNTNLSYTFTNIVYYATEDVMYQLTGDANEFFVLQDKYSNLISKYNQLTNKYEELDKNLKAQIENLNNQLTNEKIKSQLYKSIVNDTEDIIKETRKERIREGFKKVLIFTLGFLSAKGGEKIP